MTVRDFPPRPQYVEPDSPEMLGWLDKLRNRQNIDDLLEATSVSNVDETYLFSVSTNQVRKITVSNLTGLAAGTVLSVNITGTNGISVTGSPITVSGTITLSLASISPTNVSTGTVTASTVSAVTITATNVRATNVSAGTVTASTVSATNVTSATATITGVFSGQGLVDISGASAGQIKFPATQNASSDANTQDDYEEGTWTPADGSGASLSFTSVNGLYTKIGNAVMATGAFTYPVTVNGNNSLVSGFPFSLAANTGTEAGLLSYHTGATAIKTLANNGSTNANFYTAAGGLVSNAQMSATVNRVQFNYNV